MTGDVLICINNCIDDAVSPTPLTDAAIRTTLHDAIFSRAGPRPDPGGVTRCARSLRAGGPALGDSLAGCGGFQTQQRIRTTDAHR